MLKFTNPDIYLDSWEEDFSHENGNYLCNCFVCKRNFLGHKRRVVCKTCSKTEQSVASIIQKEKNDGMVDLKFDFEAGSTRSGRFAAVEEFLSSEVSDITDNDL